MEKYERQMRVLWDVNRIKHEGEFDHASSHGDKQALRTKEELERRERKKETPGLLTGELCKRRRGEDEGRGGHRGQIPRKRGNPGSTHNETTELIVNGCRSKETHWKRLGARFQEG